MLLRPPPLPQQHQNLSHIISESDARQSSKSRNKIKKKQNSISFRNKPIASNNQIEEKQKQRQRQRQRDRDRDREDNGSVHSHASGRSKKSKKKESSIGVNRPRGGYIMANSPRKDQEQEEDIEVLDYVDAKEDKGRNYGVEYSQVKRDYNHEYSPNVYQNRSPNIETKPSFKNALNNFQYERQPSYKQEQDDEIPVVKLVQAKGRNQVNFKTNSITNAISPKVAQKKQTRKLGQLFEESRRNATQLGVSAIPSQVNNSSLVGESRRSRSKLGQLFKQKSRQKQISNNSRVSFNASSNYQASISDLNLHLDSNVQGHDHGTAIRSKQKQNINKNNIPQKVLEESVHQFEAGSEANNMSELNLSMSKNSPMVSKQENYPSSHDGYKDSVCFNLEPERQRRKKGLGLASKMMKNQDEMIKFSSQLMSKQIEPIKSDGRNIISAHDRLKMNLKQNEKYLIQSGVMGYSQEMNSKEEQQRLKKEQQKYEREQYLAREAAAAQERKRQQRILYQQNKQMQRKRQQQMRIQENMRRQEQKRKQQQIKLEADKRREEERKQQERKEKQRRMEMERRQNERRLQQEAERSRQAEQEEAERQREKIMQRKKQAEEERQRNLEKQKQKQREREKERERQRQRQKQTQRQKQRQRQRKEQERQYQIEQQRLNQEQQARKQRERIRNAYKLQQQRIKQNSQRSLVYQLQNQSSNQPVAKIKKQNEFEHLPSSYSIQQSSRDSSKSKQSRKSTRKKQGVITSKMPKRVIGDASPRAEESFYEEVQQEKILKKSQPIQNVESSQAPRKLMSFTESDDLTYEPKNQYKTDTYFYDKSSKAYSKPPLSKKSSSKSKPKQSSINKKQVKDSQIKVTPVVQGKQPAEKKLSLVELAMRKNYEPESGSEYQSQDSFRSRQNSVNSSGSRNSRNSANSKKKQSTIKIKQSNVSNNFRPPLYRRNSSQNEDSLANRTAQHEKQMSSREKQKYGEVGQKQQRPRIIKGCSFIDQRGRLVQNGNMIVKGSQVSGGTGRIGGLTQQKFAQRLMNSREGRRSRSRDRSLGRSRASSRSIEKGSSKYDSRGQSQYVQSEAYQQSEYSQDRKYETSGLNFYSNTRNDQSFYQNTNSKNFPNYNHNHNSNQKNQRTIPQTLQQFMKPIEQAGITRQPSKQNNQYGYQKKQSDNGNKRRIMQRTQKPRGY